MVETPRDNTPPYDPQHQLSPEFGGTSSYEIGMRDMKREAMDPEDLGRHVLGGDWSVCSRTPMSAPKRSRRRRRPSRHWTAYMRTLILG